MRSQSRTDQKDVRIAILAGINRSTSNARNLLPSSDECAKVCVCNQPKIKNKQINVYTSSP